MAYIFAGALPASELSAINEVTVLPDVDGRTPYSEQIFLLYRDDVLTGNDAQGTFAPNEEISRGQAAIISRVALTSERKTLSLH